MNAIAPFSRSGSCLLSNAALRVDTISAFEWPAITILVRRSAIGNIDLAAWRFRHSAPLTFGFQNSGESNSASIKYCSTGAIFEYFDCAAAFGTRKQMLITS